MRKTNLITKFLCFALILVLTAAMALTMTACTNDTITSSQVELANELEFTFKVVDADGNEESFEIKTDKTIVGDALLAEGLISGDEAQYGLYVKTVNGITVDYDADGSYWAFYVDGEYAMSGVDSTKIVEGCEYSFRVEK